MRLLCSIFLVCFFGLFIIALVFKVIGAVLGLTFGIIGGLLSIIFAIVFNPIILIAAIVVLIFSLRRKKRS